MFKSAIWDFAGKFLNQVLTFIMSVVLTRLLLPGEFGLVGIVLVFVTFSAMLFDFGFKNAIINQQNISISALSTIFYINLIASVLVVIVFLFVAGPIAAYYHEPLLEKLLKCATVLFIINAALIVPSALNQKNLKFKANAVITVIATLISGIVSIWMAYKGWGVWSILFKSIIQSLIICSLSWLICKWIPKLTFSFSTIKPLLAYSSTLFLTAILDTLFQRADVLVIGKKYSSATLGYYTRAQTLESVSRELLSGIMYSVFFPYFSKIKDDARHVLLLYKKCLHVVSFFLLSVNGVLFLNARQIIIILFTSKWLASVAYFKLFIIIGFVFTANVIIGILIASTGKYKLFLRLEVFKRLIFVPVYAFGFLGNIQTFIFVLLSGYLLILYVNMVFTNKILNITPLKQSTILLNYLIPAVLSVLICWLVFRNRIDNPYIHTLITGITYTILYVSFNVVMKNKALKLLYAKLPIDIPFLKTRRRYFK